MKIINMFVRRYRFRFKCPRITPKKYITVHNTANSATAKQEASYMRRNKNTVSFHAVVDENTLVKCIPWNRNSFNSATWEGNEYSYSIEIARSTHGNVELFRQAEKNAVKYIATLLKSQGWGVDSLRTHQNWSGKYCPHKTLDWGWERFKNMVQKELNELKANKPQKIHDKIKKKILGLTKVLWKNGSTNEDVFKLSTLEILYGLIFKRERGMCVGKTGNSYIVEYNLTGTSLKKIGYVEWHGGVKFDEMIKLDWQNGSTKEYVYERSNFTKPIGYIYPGAKAKCLGRTNNAYIVEYYVPSIKKKKVGYVKYSGKVNI